MDGLSVILGFVQSLSEPLRNNHSCLYVNLGAYILGKSGEGSSAIKESLLGAWPILLLMLSSALLAAVIMWMLVRRTL